MQTAIKHTIIGVFGAAVLAGFLQIIHVITGSKAYILLYNVDYIPILNTFDRTHLTGIFFHIFFCIASVVLLYPLLKIFSLENRIWSYVFVYTSGSGILYVLTALTDRPPELGDMSAWFYWTLGHLIYSLVVGGLITRSPWLKTDRRGGSREESMTL